MAEIVEQVQEREAAQVCRLACSIIIIIIIVVVVIVSILYFCYTNYTISALLRSFVLALNWLPNNGTACKRYKLQNYYLNNIYNADILRGELFLLTIHL